jgi:hypothetical protein
MSYVRANTSTRLGHKTTLSGPPNIYDQPVHYGAGEHRVPPSALRIPFSSLSGLGYRGLTIDDSPHGQVPGGYWLVKDPSLRLPDTTTPFADPEGRNISDYFMLPTLVPASNTQPGLIPTDPAAPTTPDETALRMLAPGQNVSAQVVFPGGGQPRVIVMGPGVSVDTGAMSQQTDTLAQLKAWLLSDSLVRSVNAPSLPDIPNWGVLAIGVVVARMFAARGRR